MTNIVFSPTLQAPIALSNPTGSISLASDPTVVATQANPIPTQGAIALIGAAVRLALAMATNAGSVSFAGVTPSVISGLVTPRSPAVGALSTAGVSPTLAISSGTPQLTFPRLMLVGVGGDQSYGSNSGTGFPAWTTAAAGTAANTAIQTIASYDIAIIAGVNEGWDSNGARDRENLTLALGKQATTYAITKNTTRATLAFYYEIMNVTVAGNPYAQWQSLVVAKNWFLYPLAAGGGTATSFINYSAAWPGAIGSAGAGASICGSNYGSTSTGSPTGAQGPARTFGNYAAIKLLMRAYAGDSRFSFNAQMGSPSAAGIFLDECFIALDGDASTGSASLDGVTIAPGTQQGGGFPGLDTVQPCMARGNRNMFDQLQTMLALVNPGKIYYNFANFGQYANKYQFGAAALTCGLEGTLHGGLLENSIGAGASSWECFQTGNPNTGNTTYASGWPNLLTNYYQGMDFCLAPKLVGLGTKLPAVDGSQTASWPVGAGTTQTTVTAGTALEYQLMRYALCTTLLDDGYFAPGCSGYDWSKVRWYDEFGDDSLAQVNVKRGYLGLPLTARPSAATWNQGPLGVWSRQFTNGIAIVNPRGNGAQTVTLPGTYQALTGTQQPTINNGAVISSLTIGDGDGRILLPYTDPYATRGPLAGDVWLNWNAATDGTGTQTSPFNTFTSARLLALSQVQGMFVQGSGPWPNTGSGAQSGTPNNRILIKQWPGGAQGGFTFTGGGAQTGGGAYWDLVGLTLSCAYNGLCLGDNYAFTGGSGRSTNWRFIDCIGTRTGDPTKTDNQGIIYASGSGALDGHSVIRGSYTGPSGEGNNQANLFFDYPTNLTILGVLADQAANPIYLKHTQVSTQANIVIKNCIIRRAGRAFTCPANYVLFSNCAIESCLVNPADEGGNPVSPGNNWTVNHCTFVNSDYQLDPGSHNGGVLSQNANNVLTNCAWIGTSRFMDNPFGKQINLDMHNLSNYSACNGTTTVHYYRNSTARTLAQQKAAFPTQEINGIAGTVTLVGGTTPGAIPGNWALAVGSTGKGVASDGTDCGVNAANLLTVN